MKLTKNFTKAEFESKDGSKMPTAVLAKIKELAINLQVLRDEVGKPIVVTSGYRSPAHNKMIGGASASKHVLGQAADFKVSGMTPKQIFDVITRLINKGKMKSGGLKAYSTFVHYDIRGYNARW